VAATTTLWGYLHLSRVLTLYDAGSGKVASTAGVSDTACRAGVDSSVGGAVSSPATTVAGSSSSQVKSVDFLQST
jgi:hypothetical protein